MNRFSGPCGALEQNSESEAKKQITNQRLYSCAEQYSCYILLLSDSGFILVKQSPST